MSPWWLRPPAEELDGDEPKAPEAPPPPTDQSGRKRPAAAAKTPAAAEAGGAERRRKRAGPRRPPRDRPSPGKGRGQPVPRAVTPQPDAAAQERRIALFCDLENVALGLRQADGPRFDLSLVIERLLEKGRIIVKKGYADWERLGGFKRSFHEAGVELIHIPHEPRSEESSIEIKLVVDALELCYSKQHIDTFVIVSGAGELSPLISKLKENNKLVLGIGARQTASPALIDNCDEYLFYEDLRSSPVAKADLEGVDSVRAEAFELMVASILALKRENKEVLWGSMIKQTMQRKRPSFSESQCGYSAFSELLEDAERQGLVELERDERSGSYIVTDFAVTKD